MDITGRCTMTFEDEYLDVLQNIEFAIISVYRQHPDVRDSVVLRAIEAVIDTYRAEARGLIPKPLKLPETEAVIFARVREVCDLRLGRGGLGMIAEQAPAQDKTVEEIMACLRRIRKSVERWNKRGGQQGYVTFVNQFIK
jgi:hypothetical protein